MKKALFNPKWYFEETFFKKEEEKIFSEKWIFAGVKNWIKKNGDFFTLPLAGKEIVIHNLNNEIKSYLNICPHRGGPLVQGIQGNSMPICKYHGWAFREGDHLTGQTNHEWFSSDQKDDSCGRKLFNVHTKVMGPLVFINQSKNPINFNDQFNSELVDLFEKMGNLSDTGFCQFISPMNWKLNIENVKDYLHPYYIHEDSFIPYLKMEKSIPTRITSSNRLLNAYENKVTLADLSFNRKSEFSVNDVWWKKFIKVTQPENTYQNTYLFPNTNFFSVSGAYYVFQQYLPLTSKSFTYRMVIAIPEKSQKFDSNALINSLMQLERNVIKEDDAILTKVQNNLEKLNDQDFYTHGDYEVDIMNQMIYLNSEVYQK
jgi:phenylpropionate dioxygenase-like ring-hydroxylating dioxygenase large terminal subunit